MGGGVKGAQILGKHPAEMTVDMDLNLGRGRILPTMSWEGMWQGVLQWFGVAEESMPMVLPNLANFPAKERIAKAQLFASD
jgi:cullin-associated NEDD8-dissociated protein 1